MSAASRKFFHRNQNVAKLLAERAEAIFDSWWNLWIYGALDDSCAFEVSKPLRQSLGAESREPSQQRCGALAAMKQFAQNGNRPFACEEVYDPIYGADRLGELEAVGIVEV